MIYKTFCEKDMGQNEMTTCPLSHTPAISAEKYWITTKSKYVPGVARKKDPQEPNEKVTQ